MKSTAYFSIAMHQPTVVILEETKQQLKSYNQVCSGPHYLKMLIYLFYNVTGVRGQGISLTEMRDLSKISWRLNFLMFGESTSWDHSCHPMGISTFLVAVDYVSKWVEAIALATNDSKGVSQFLKKNIFTRFETPRAIISDGGTIFVINMWMHFLPNTESHTRLPLHIILRQVAR